MKSLWREAILKFRVPGSMEPGICVASLCHNEISILPLYYKFVKQFADTWIILDDGSTDGSVEYIKRLQDLREIDIMLVSRPAFHVAKHRVYWANWNYAFKLCDREWTLLGYLDEIAYPNPAEYFNRMMKEHVVWKIGREEIVSLNPLKSLGPEGPFVRFFPTGSTFFEAKAQSAHVEHPITKLPIKEAPFRFFHIGRCREIKHIQEKERAYEACGPSALTSHYDQSRRLVDIKNAHLIPDNGFTNWLLGG